MPKPIRQITNRHAGDCTGCGTRVSPGMGYAEIYENGGKWSTRCMPCVDGSTPTPAPIATPVDDRPTFPLTEEQKAVVRAFNEGHSLAVQAGAGTGKTSTLIAIAKSTTRVGQFVAFNKDIVKAAAAKMPPNVTCSTQHSLAYRQVGKLYRHRLDSPRQSSQEIARRLRLDPFFYAFGSERKVIQPSTLAGYVMKAIGRFSNSADAAPSIDHMEYIEGVDLPMPSGTRTYAVNDKIRAHCAGAIRAAWADIADVDGQLRFTPDNYLKIWQLGIFGKPVIPGEYILFDEAQDADAVMLSVVEQQDKQVVFVGDSQQAIYEWRGAVDAMSNVPADATLFLTHSFRFGPEIAGAANTVLGQIESAELRITGKGAPGIVAHHPAPDAILCRTNAGAVTTVIAALEAGRLPFLVGGGGDTAKFAKAAQKLMTGQHTTHPELCIFDTWSAVQEYVDQDPMGGELAAQVRLIDKYGVDVVLQAVGGDIAEQDADLVVSTAHKSKGLEWDGVRLAGDFPIDRMDDAEYRLLYVAVTRARLHLDVEGCPAAIEAMYPERADEARDMAAAVKAAQ